MCLNWDVCSKVLKIASIVGMDVDDNGKLVALGSQFGIMALL